MSDQLQQPDAVATDIMARVFGPADHAWPKGLFNSIVAAMENEVAALRERVAALSEALRHFRRGHLYADEELKHVPLPERDAKPLNPYDPERSPTVGDCRRAAAVLREQPT